MASYLKTNLMGKQTVVHPHNGRWYKQMSYEATESHGGTINARYWTKGASLKRLQAV